MNKFVLLAFALGLAACGGHGAPGAVTHGALTLSGGWAPASPGGARTAAGYLRIQNNGADTDYLLGAASPRASSVELHVTEMSGSMMIMKRADQLAAPAHGVLELKPGAAHLMFFAPLPPFKPGQTIPITLQFQRAGRVAYALTVRAAAPDEAMGPMAPMRAMSAAH